MVHGRGVDKALLAEEKPLESQSATFISIHGVHVTKARGIQQICNSLAL